MAYNMKEIIITVSVLIICIMLVRRVCRGKVGSRFQYALWFLVALRLVIPVSIPLNLPVAEFVGRHHLIELNTDEVVEQLEKPIQVTVSSRSGIYHLLADEDVQMNDASWADSDGPSVSFMVGHLRYSWLDVLGMIWIGGMFVVGVWFVAANWIFSRRLKKDRRRMELSEEKASALQKKLPPKIAGMYNKVTVYRVEGLVSPCLYGMPGREAVYLSSDIEKDTDRLCHVLTHELCHKKHGDSFWSILRGLLVTIYWFHPLVWAAAVLSKRDCELACDETALLFLGEEERISYGETLLSIITQKARFLDLFCNATTMTGSGKSVKERIGFIAKKPQLLRTAVALTAVLMALAFVFAFMRTQERIRIVVFGQEIDTVTGADMQIPLPDSIRGVCGQVTEEGNDDIVIYHVKARQEIGRFARMSLKDTLQLVDEGRQVVPIGDYGDNELLKAYLGIPADIVRVTSHTYTPAKQDAREGYGMLSHEDIIISDGNDSEGAVGVPGTDSNTTQIPAPEATDSYAIFLPYEEGQSLDAEKIAAGSDVEIEYLPNEEITTTVTYPPKEVDIDALSHTGCYVYIKADYGKVQDEYFQEMERINEELEKAAEDVVVLSLNGEIREELLDALTKNRTLYVGDNTKVGALVNALPVPSTLNFIGDIALQTVERPYSIRFKYEMTASSIPQEDMDMLYFNAVMLFYAIDNVEEITVSGNPPVGSDKEALWQVYNRADMEEIFDGLAEADYENEERFRQGLEELHNAVVAYLHFEE